MCGIVGRLVFGRDLRAHRPVVRAMVETMRLRGPDDEGVRLPAHAARGHRRLAVTDIEGGRQPMLAEEANPEGPVVLVYSGEVYDFQELGAERASPGYVIRTRSDTEVVLRAYQDRLLGDRSSPLCGVLDTGKLGEPRSRGERTRTWLNAAHPLLPLLEIDIWMREYGIRLA